MDNGEMPESIKGKNKATHLGKCYLAMQMKTIQIVLFMPASTLVSLIHILRLLFIEE